MDSLDLTKAFGAFFAIMNPFINLPIFLALTGDFSQGEQRALAVKITIYSAAMCAVILFAGQAVIGFFGITVDQFRIAGGIVLAHIAWSMLQGAPIAAHHGSGAEQQQIKDLSGLAFYPITFPMVVGPGTIATLIIYAGHAGGPAGLAAIAGIVAAILALQFVVLFFAAQIGKVLSDTMRTITTRLMGMILLAIAVSMLVAGLTASFPVLSRSS